MPSLLAFRRRWNISSDDFVFPGITEAFVRLVWILAASALFMVHNPFQCKSLEWMAYLGLLVVGNVVTIFFCIATAVESAKGSILDVNVRKNVVKLIYCRVPLFLVEIIYTTLSAIFAFGLLEIDKCFSLISLRITVVLELFLIFCVFLGIIMVFNTHGGQSVERSFLVERRYWQTRMILCKIRQNDEMRSALDEIASLLAAFFAETDYVASDILVGLLLLVHSPEQPPAIEMQLNDDDNHPQWMKLPESLNMICRMLDFSVAVYGWPSYLINNCSCISWYRLLKSTKCCFTCGDQELHSIDDNCCSCNTVSFLLESKLEKSDLIYVSFRNKLYQTPFVVFLDHSSQSIVITIRGSASILDFVTDLSLNEDVFTMGIDLNPIRCNDKQLNSDEALRVHRGMLRSAHFVYNDLKKNRIIEDLRILNPSYQLVICGHSLGAGVASLLTLLLKHHYSDIKCFSFSPPGCVISEHGIEETENFILSVIIGDDIIPRISYQSLMRLKIAIDNEISNTTRAKYEILIKGIFKLFFSAPWDLHSDNLSTDNRSCRRLINNDDYAVRANDDLNEQIMSSESSLQRTRLYPPGRLLHFAVDPTTKETTFNWIKQDYLKDIQLTGSILADHMPHRVRRLLQKARDENVFV